MFCLQNNKGVFFTKGATEDVLMHVARHLALAVNKSDCCLIRVTPSEMRQPQVWLPYEPSVEHVLDEMPSSLSFTALLMNRLHMSHQAPDSFFSLRSALKLTSPNDPHTEHMVFVGVFALFH